MRLHVAVLSLALFLYSGVPTGSRLPPVLSLPAWVVVVWVPHSCSGKDAKMSILSIVVVTLFSCRSNISGYAAKD